MFIVVIDWVMKNGDIDDIDMEYANKIGLHKSNTENAQKQLHALSGVDKEIGLMTNVVKTKVLPKKIDSIAKFMLDETVLEVVGVLKYLAAWVNDNMKDFKHSNHGKPWTELRKI